MEMEVSHDDTIAPIQTDWDINDKYLRLKKKSIRNNRKIRWKLR
jgi:hypothetical protein